MNDTLGGIVINLNAYGATIRLDDGDLAGASAAEVQAHRSRYEGALVNRKRLAFEVRRIGRRATVLLAPQIRDDEFEAQIASYLRSTQEWESDEMPAAQRHFLRKKRRAALFVTKP